MIKNFYAKISKDQNEYYVKYQIYNVSTDGRRLSKNFYKIYYKAVLELDNKKLPNSLKILNFVCDSISNVEVLLSGYKYLLENRYIGETHLVYDDGSNNYSFKYGIGFNNDDQDNMNVNQLKSILNRH